MALEQESVLFRPEQDSPVISTVIQSNLVGSAQELLEQTELTSATRGNFVRADITLGKQLGGYCGRLLATSGICSYGPACHSEVIVVIREPDISTTTFEASCYAVPEDKRANCYAAHRAVVEPYLSDTTVKISHL